MEMLRDVTLV